MGGGGNQVKRPVRRYFFYKIRNYVPRIGDYGGRSGEEGTGPPFRPSMSPLLRALLRSCSRATIILSPLLLPSRHIRHPFTTVSYDRPNKFIFPSPPIPLSSFLSFRSVLLAAPFSSSIVHFLRHEFSRSIIAQQERTKAGDRS